MEVTGSVSAALAIAGVVLNNRKLVGCFYLWMASNMTSMCLHVHASIWSLAARDCVFFILAIEGLIRWSKKEKG